MPTPLIGNVKMLLKLRYFVPVNIEIITWQKIKSSNYIKLKSREIKAFARDILKLIIKEKEKNTLNPLG